VTNLAAQHDPAPLRALSQSPLPSHGSPAIGGANDASSFARHLLAADAAPQKPETPEDRARRGAEELVSLTFIEPILAMVRESEGGAQPFKPTRGEKQFRALLDADLAQRIVKSAQFPLVDRLARDLLRAAPAPEVGTTSPPAMDAVG